MKTYSTAQKLGYTYRFQHTYNDMRPFIAYGVTQIQNCISRSRF